MLKTLVDIGTGAGFPGVPIKIVFPHIKMVLLDSLRKRVDFLSEVISILELEEIEAIHERAENLSRKEEYREKFDLCTSRAVANLATLSEYCMPL
jgi:16S rRNA (guanine527-N7)-methyltransferase